MKKYILILTLLFLSFLVVGCSNKEVDTPKSKIIITASAESRYSMVDAKKLALADLASQIKTEVNEVFSSKEFSSRKASYHKATHTIKNSSKIIFKYIEYHNEKVDEPLFGRNKYSISASLTNESLSKYLATVTTQRKKILSKVYQANNQVAYFDKKKFIDSLLREINKYNESLQVLFALDRSKTNLTINESLHSLNRKINAKPRANFQMQKCSKTVYPGCKVRFKSISKDDGHIVNYKWDFGDGSYSTDAHSIHRYKKIGNYNVSLVVEDDQGITSSHIAGVEVKNSPPKARFRITQEVYSLMDDISFENHSTDYDGKIISHYWDFGDGETSSKKNPVHQYQSPGRYSIKLSVTDDRGSRNTFSDRIVVKHPVEIDVKYGMTAKHLQLLLGLPEEKIEKTFSSVKAHLYHYNWVILKDNIVQCVVKEKAFTKNFMGYPKSCSWHLKKYKNYVGSYRL